MEVVILLFEKLFKTKFMKKYLFPTHKNKYMRTFLYIFNWILIPLGLIFFFSPKIFGGILYVHIWGNLDKMIPIILGIFGLIYAVKLRFGGSIESISNGKKVTRANKRRSLLIGIPAVIIGILGGILGETVSDYYTYKNQANFIQRDSLVETNIDAFRFTPGSIAYSEMLGSFNRAGNTIVKEDVNPYYGSGSFGHIVQVSPSDDSYGNKFNKKNPGWMIYNDDPNSEDKTSFVEQEITYGEGMLFFDNLMRKVTLKDPFAKYDDPNHIKIDGLDGFVTVVPKIKYKYRFPFFIEDIWEGSVIVYPDGTIEYYTAEQISKKPEFKNRWLGSKSIMKNYVQLQTFKVGFWNVFLDKYLPMKVQGMIEISDTEDKTENPFPHVYEGADGQTYFSIPVEPEGEGQALSAYYYGNTSDYSDLTYYEFDADNTVISAAKALDLTRNISGYLWYDEVTNPNGTHVPIDAAEIIKNGKLFWKVSITTRKSKARTVAETIVYDALNPQKVLRFSDRSSFEAWLRDNQSENSDYHDKNTSLRKKLIQKLRNVRYSLDEFEETLQMIPDSLLKNTTALDSL